VVTDANLSSNGLIAIAKTHFQLIKLADAGTLTQVIIIKIISAGISI